MNKDSLNILVVEDHVDTAAILSLLLESLGHRVKVSHTAADALDKALAEPFDLLISDLGLPDSNGLAVMHTLKNISGAKGIAVSGYGGAEDMRRSRDAGFSEHLTKPVDVDLLEKTIKRVMAA